MNYLEFIETSAFSMLRKDLMDDDEFRELQTYLLEAHDRGDTISIPGDAERSAGVALEWESGVG